jgi:hypothetical protein
MDESREIARIPAIETIWSILAQKDPENILLRPDLDGIYSPEAFMRNLELPRKDLERLVSNYCTLVIGQIKMQLTPSEQKRDDIREPVSNPKNMPNEPEVVMYMLTFPKSDKYIADIRRIEPAIWMLKKSYSLDTGADFSNSSIEPFLVLQLKTIDSVEKIKKIVREALQKR